MTERKRQDKLQVSGILSEERELWRVAAEMDDRSLSNWIRRACNEKARRDMRLDPDAPIPAHLLGATRP